MEEHFTNTYESLRWGNNKAKLYKGSSGNGSSIVYNEKTYIPFLKDFILENKIKSVIDLGCGDFQCGSLIYDDLDVKYTGYDIYKKVIESNILTFPKYTFEHLDFYNKKEELVTADLCILKDVLQHWKTSEIYIFLDYLTSTKKYKYILITNCAHQKEGDSINKYSFFALSSKYLPLSKYNPTVIYKWDTKEVCLINCLY